MATPPILNPIVPYIGYITGGVFPGKRIVIYGSPHGSAKQFNINLQCGSNVNPRDDIALHISVRFEWRSTVFNSLHYQQWGPEEKGSSFSFYPGRNYEIQIKIEHDKYIVSSNGEHIHSFAHRMPSNQATHLTIDGDTSVSQIRFDSGDNYAFGGTAQPGGGFPMPPSSGLIGAGYPPTSTPYPLGGPSVPYSGGHAMGAGAPPLYPTVSSMGGPPAGYPPNSAQGPPYGGPPPPYAHGGPPPMYPQGGAPAYPGMASGPPGYGAQGYPQNTSGRSPSLTTKLTAAAAGIPIAGGLLAGIAGHKAHKKMKHKSPKKRGIIPGIPIGGGGLLAGAGALGAGYLGAKALKKGFKHKHKHSHGFYGRRSSSSSSSSSSSD